MFQKNKDKILLVLFCIFLPILLILFSYKMVLSFSSLTMNQQETINFLKGKAELNLEYTSNEMSHLIDVKKVMQNMNYLFYLSLLICTLILTYYKESKKNKANKEIIKKKLRYGSIGSLIILGVVFLFVIINFNFSFTIFNEIFFPQGNWVFSEDSLIIQTFPIKFFINITLKIFILALLVSSTILLKIRRFK